MLLEAETYRAGLATEATRQEVIAHATELWPSPRTQCGEEISLAQEPFSELPYSYILDGRLENRVIDLLYLDSFGWHIGDFKTDPHTYPFTKSSSFRLMSSVRRYYKAMVIGQEKLVPVGGFVSWMI